MNLLQTAKQKLLQFFENKEILIVVLVFLIQMFFSLGRFFPTLRDINLWDEAVYINTGRLLVSGVSASFCAQSVDRGLICFDLSSVHGFTVLVNAKRFAWAHYPVHSAMVERLPACQTICEYLSSVDLGRFVIFHDNGDRHPV